MRMLTIRQEGSHLFYQPLLAAATRYREKNDLDDALIMRVDAQVLSRAGAG
jgi:hypothetical protein